jgi:hypothetical protein
MDQATIQKMVDGFGDKIKDAFESKSEGGGKNPAKEPTQYDGSPEGYEAFRASLVLYVVALKTETDMVVSALSYLTKGRANLWAQEYQLANIDDINGTGVNWKPFLDAMDEYFRDPYVEQKATLKLAEYKQRGQSAHDFFIEYDRIRLQSKTNKSTYDSLLVKYLQANMNVDYVLAVDTAHRTAVKTAIDHIDLLEKIGIQLAAGTTFAQLRTNARKPITYDQFRKYAIDLDASLQKKLNRDRFQHRTTTTTTTFATPGPSKVTQTRTSPGDYTGRPSVTPMDIDNARQKGLCFNCGEHGHIARNCPTKKTRNQGRQGVRSLEYEEPGSPKESTDNNSEEQDFPNPQ